MKKVLSSLVLIAVLLLAACGGESKSDKEVVVDAFTSMMEAESYQSTSTLDLNINADINDPFIAPYLQMINDIELSVDSVFDAEREMQEAVIHFSGTISPLSINLDLPMLQDLKNQKMYIETDSLIDNFGMFLGLPDEFKGKLIEIDMAELEGAEPIDVDEINEQAKEMLVEFLNEKSDEEYSKDGNVYTVEFTKEDLVTLVNALLEDFDDTLTAQDLELVKEELTTALDQIDFNQFEVQLTVDGDELKAQKFVIDLGIDADGDYVEVALTIDTTYENFNGDVEFSIDPDNYEILDMYEFEQLLLGF